MQVNSVRNLGITAFGEGNTENIQPKGAVNEILKEQSAVEIKPQPEADKFEKAQDISKNNNLVGIQMPSMSQISKMQTTQKVLGGTLFTVGVLGALSFLSPKKWVTALFTVPVGGIMAYFGANMFNMARALDKLKSVSNPPQA